MLYFNHNIESSSHEKGGIKVMKIGGMQKLTLLDYPDHMACLLFTQGCNMRCPFCHNSGLLAYDPSKAIDEKEVLNYLEKRRGLLNGVVISGGEPTLQRDLIDFIRQIKLLGYDIKLDTNGTDPVVLETLLKEHLVDYVAMDIKNDFMKYEETTGVSSKLEPIKRSIGLLKASGIDYEFRTTVVKELHEFHDIKNICEYLGPQSKYYLQNYRESEGVLKKGLTSFAPEELSFMENILQKDYPLLKTR